MVYCVEDDSGIRDLMIYALKASGFDAEGFADGREFFSALSENLPEIVLLDIMLPGEDGLSILKELRSNAATARMPVIIATAKGTEYDKVIGLDSGADDYLAKPFGMMEMVSRVKALLRRSRPEAVKDELIIGDLCLSTAEHTVRAGDKAIDLTLKEFNLLKLFLENKGLVFTREQLLSKIWGEQFIGESRTVDVHIATLRTKLGKWGDCIKTVRGVGYRMEDKL